MITHQLHNSQSNFNYNAYIYENTSYSPHFHKNFELIYVMEGLLTVAVNGVTKVLPAGDMALVLSNQIHAFAPQPETKIWVAVFSEEYVPRFSSAVKGKQGKRFDFTPSASVRILIEEQLIRSEGSVYMKKACFYAVCDCYLAGVELESRSGKTDFMVGKFLDYVAEHYAENISLKSIASDFGYEYHYFSRLLSREYGISFKQLVNRYRVESAVHLLESAECSVTEVAAKSGFQSIRSFNHVFKEYVGCTPKEYKPE